MPIINMVRTILPFILFACSAELNTKPKPLKTWDTLQKGNKQFAQDRNYAQQRAQVAVAQHPESIILSCSDSRVPPELIFNQGIGALFVVRVAGQVIDDVVVDSVDYAVRTFKPTLIVVLGHTNCGAVSGALDRLRKNNGNIVPHPHHLDAVLNPH